MSKKIGVLLSGCGVYDGTEIHEAVLSLLAVQNRNADAVCMAPDVDQHHVVNHLNGDEMNEKRNVLVESARIARGEISSLKDVNADELDALLIPGGFGTAKNHTKWALEGPDGEINSEVKKTILHFVENKKPILGLCMGPTTIAKALEGSGVSAALTVGTTEEESPYDIEGIGGGMEKAGMKNVMKTVREVHVDKENKIVTAPCYMMQAHIGEIHKNIEQATDELFKLL